MFERFLEKYSPTPGSSGPFPSWSLDDTRQLVGVDVAAHATFMRQCARTSFDRGVIRFLPPTTLRSWNGEGGWKDHWRSWSERLVVLAVDWRGNQVALDRARLRDGQPLVGILDVGAGEYLEVPASFEEYCETELVDFAEEAVSALRFEAWLARGGPAPGEGQCIGFTQPLFLGGADSLDNMALTDLSVYVDLQGQLHEQTKNLAPGSKVRGVSIK